ncbi:hypothetical protein [Pseudoalteromonas byunsanensis]|uniref:Uncharacterized protein n=1 Tax=Pseudoalteromonas byunsanensis TaxID=327939 RepID=A0A1S1NED2_9GAMM|nr:hypothetical protein [Pseudoalteromonas byunsanensis]OHU97161.1 hypothetical protein BIW53_02245 [Pseudoalteromonas byunsanensis]
MNDFLQSLQQGKERAAENDNNKKEINEIFEDFIQNLSTFLQIELTLKFKGEMKVEAPTRVHQPTRRPMRVIMPTLADLQVKEESTGWTEVQVKAPTHSPISLFCIRYGEVSYPLSIKYSDVRKTARDKDDLLSILSDIARSPDLHYKLKPIEPNRE